MKWLICLLVCASLTLVGCSKKPESTAREVQPLATINTGDNAAPPPADATAAPTPDAPAPAAGTEELAEAAETLNSILREYLDNGNPMPKSLDEMVSLKIVRTMPKPPPGKKFALDTKKGKVIVVNQ